MFIPSVPFTHKHGVKLKHTTVPTLSSVVALPQLSHAIREPFSVLARSSHGLAWLLQALCLIKGGKKLPGAKRILLEISDFGVTLQEIESDLDELLITFPSWRRKSPTDQVTYICKEFLLLFFIYSSPRPAPPPPLSVRDRCVKNQTCA